MVREEFMKKMGIELHLKGKPGYGQRGKQKKFQGRKMAYRFHFLSFYTYSTFSHNGLEMDLSTHYSGNSKYTIPARAMFTLRNIAILWLKIYH